MGRPGTPEVGEGATAPRQQHGRRERGPRPSLRVRFRRDPAAPAAARLATSDWCREHALEDSRFQSARLLVSEVVSNAVRHSHGPAEEPILLRGSIVEDRIRIAVSDGGEGFTPMPRDPSRIIGGYGLLLLERIARSWGVERVGGTCVWFEL